MRIHNAVLATLSLLLIVGAVSHFAGLVVGIGAAAAALALVSVGSVAARVRT